MASLLTSTLPLSSKHVESHLPLPPPTSLPHHTHACLLLTLYLSSSLPHTPPMVGAPPWIDPSPSPPQGDVTYSSFFLVENIQPTQPIHGIIGADSSEVTRRIGYISGKYFQTHMVGINSVFPECQLTKILSQSQLMPLCNSYPVHHQAFSPFRTNVV